MRAELTSSETNTLEILTGDFLLPPGLTDSASLDTSAGRNFLLVRCCSRRRPRSARKRTQESCELTLARDLEPLVESGETGKVPAP